MSKIDFSSGDNNNEILCRLLDHFRLLHQSYYRGSDSPGSLTSQVNILCKQLIEKSIPMKLDILQTGSTAEMVNIMKLTVPGVRKSLFYARELDLMLVIEVEELIAGKYDVQQCRSNPAFLTIRVSNDETNTELLHRTSGVTYLSPPLLKAKLLRDLAANKDFSTEVKSPEGICISYHIKELEDHGAAIMITAYKKFKEMPGQRSYYNDVDGISTREALVDIVPAIKLCEWPEGLREWINRERLWPPPSIVEQIVAGGVMVVCKAGVEGNVDTDWRLSFSKAEITLISNRDKPARQHALRILKFMVKYMISPPSTLNSYHCKTVFLWACERLSPEVWEWDNLHNCVLGLVNDLISAVAAKKLPHYFLPQVNLFEFIPSDFLQTAGANLVKLRKDPAPEDSSEIGYHSEDSILEDLGIGKPSNRNPYKYQPQHGDRGGYTMDKLNIDMAYLKARCNYTEEEITKLRQVHKHDHDRSRGVWGKRDLIPKYVILPDRMDEPEEELLGNSLDSSD